MCQGYLRVLAQMCSAPADAGGFMLAALFPQRQGCMLCSGLTAHTHSAIAPACYSLRHSPMTRHKSLVLVPGWACQTPSWMEVQLRLALCSLRSID